MSDNKYPRLNELNRYVTAFTKNIEKIEKATTFEEITALELDAKRQLEVIRKATAKVAWDLKDAVTARKTIVRETTKRDIKKELGL